MTNNEQPQSQELWGVLISFFTHYSYFLSSMNKLPANPPSWRNDTVLPLPMEVNAKAWAVDAACSGNPGPMEYQCIDLQTGAQVFHYGPLHGTNNIGEFLAIVHALALMEQRGITDKVIYSDSVNAQLWVQKLRNGVRFLPTSEERDSKQRIRVGH